MNSSSSNTTPAAPKYSVGDSVRVARGSPIGHCRTPSYFRDVPGIVERHCGAFANPEELAYLRDGLPPINLYRIRTLLRDLWPEYDQSSPDSIVVEVYEHWLEAQPVEDQ